MLNGRFLADTAERVGKTFVQGYAAAWVVVGGADFDALFSLDNAKLGLAAGAFAVATSLAATRVGAKDSASLLPADVDPPGPDPTTDAGRLQIEAQLLQATDNGPRPEDGEQP